MKLIENHFKVLEFRVEKLSSEYASNFTTFLKFFSTETFFGSLIYTWNSISPKKMDQFVNLFNNNPPCIFAGLFPMIDSKDKIYFLPRPLLWRNLNEVSTNITDLNVKKKWKKLDWISLNTFCKILSQKDLSFEDVQYEFDLYSILKDNYKILQRPRIQLNRDTGETALFSQPEIYFKSQLKLYIILKPLSTNNIESFLKNWIRPALKLLQFSGFGGSRNIGSGKFDFIESEIIIPEYQSDDKNSGTQLNSLPVWLTLTHFKPTPDDIAFLRNLPKNSSKTLSNYGISLNYIIMQGWGHNPNFSFPIIKPPSVFIQFGSTIPSRTPIKGCCESILFKTHKSPPNQSNYQNYYFRYGYTFPLRIK
ncbi:MAG: type III-A CRISPR-associated RAMP protein Csm4 [Candidatus Helarchaeota archaeon]